MSDCPGHPNGHRWQEGLGNRDVCMNGCGAQRRHTTVPVPRDELDAHVRLLEAMIREAQAAPQGTMVPTHRLRAVQAHAIRLRKLLD